MDFYPLIAVVLLPILIFQMLKLFEYIDQTNNRLARFLFSMEYADFSIQFPSTQDNDSFQNLHSAFNRIIKKFQKIRFENEEMNKLFHTIIQSVRAGIIVFKKDSGEIILMNHYIKRLLGCSQITTISRLPEPMFQTLNEMRHNEKKIISFCHENTFYQLLLNVTLFRMAYQEYLLLSIQNIHFELDEKETESWQKLMRTQTHELMNSITPIHSLSSTIAHLIQKPGLFSTSAQNQETIEDIVEGIASIQKRSEGLLSFVQAYRSIVKTVNPEFQLISVTEIFNRIFRLVKVYLGEKNTIEVLHHVHPPHIKFNVDPSLIEQVLLNLMINSIQSLDNMENGRIELSAGSDYQGHAWIRVTDNGVGIPPENMEKIFIPFYTTKSEGSGIGLSWSKQVMRAHNGAIIVHSKPGIETIFTLVF